MSFMSSAISTRRRDFTKNLASSSAAGTNIRSARITGSFSSTFLHRNSRESRSLKKFKAQGGPTSFAHFNRDFLARNGEGLSGLVLSSADADADKKQFDEAGFGGFQTFDFGRMGKRPDGSEAELAFSLSFLREPTSGDLMTFTAEHKRPENFLVSGIAASRERYEVVFPARFCVAESPTDHQYFLQAFTGLRDVRSTSLGVTAETPRGDVQITEPRPFEDAFGAKPPVSTGLRFGAVIFAWRRQANPRDCFEERDCCAGTRWPPRRPCAWCSARLRGGLTGLMRPSKVRRDE